MIEDLIPNNVGDIILDGLENYVKIFNDTSPKTIYRKIRFKRRYYKKYLIVYNPIHDLLPGPVMVNFMTRRISERIKKNK